MRLTAHVAPLARSMHQPNANCKAKARKQVFFYAGCSISLLPAGVSWWKETPHPPHVAGGARNSPYVKKGTAMTCGGVAVNGLSCCVLMLRALPPACFQR